MLVYILALGSPTHPVGNATPTTPGRRPTTAPGARSTGQEHLSFPPLFGHQYSHVWIDFRGIQRRLHARRGIDYFENSRRATLSQRAYAIANPRGWTGYGADVWGLTACDGPIDATHRVQGQGAPVPHLRRARRRHRVHARRRHASRRPRRSASIAVRAGDRRSRRSRRCTTATASRSTASTASSTRSTRASRSPTRTLHHGQHRRRRRLGRQRLPRHRPGPDRADDRELPQRLRLEGDARAIRTSGAAWSAPASPAAGWTSRRERPRRARWRIGGTHACSPRASRCCAACSALAARERTTDARRRALLGDGPRGRGRRAAAAGVRARASRHPRRRAAAAVDRRAREAADRLRRRRAARPVRARQHLDAGVRRARRARAAATRASRASPGIDAADYFPGIWDTNVVDGTRLRPAVVRRHARCCSTARDLLAQAGFAAPPRDWDEWRSALARGQAPGRGRSATRSCCRSTSSSRCSTSPCSSPIRCCATTARYGNFRSAGFRRALAFYKAMFDRGWAPRVSNTQISNVWDEFGNGYFAFYITGPWNIAEFRKRLPPAHAGRLDDGAAARPRRPGRLRRRRLEPGACSRARSTRTAAWQLIEYLSQPAGAGALPRADRRPAAAALAMGDPGAGATIRTRSAFRDQLERARPDAEGAGVGAHRAPRCAWSPSAIGERRADRRPGRRRTRPPRRRDPREAPLDARPRHAAGPRAMKAGARRLGVRRAGAAR